LTLGGIKISGLMGIKLTLLGDKIDLKVALMGVKLTVLSAYFLC
jgi:hypothetical protein